MTESTGTSEFLKPSAPFQSTTPVGPALPQILRNALAHIRTLPSDSVSVFLDQSCNAGRLTPPASSLQSRLVGVLNALSGFTPASLRSTMHTTQMTGRAPMRLASRGALLLRSKRSGEGV